MRFMNPWWTFCHRRVPSGQGHGSWGEGNGLVVGDLLPVVMQTQGSTPVPVSHRSSPRNNDTINLAPVQTDISSGHGGTTANN
jgi:hypothetical protein